MFAVTVDVCTINTDKACYIDNSDAAESYNGCLAGPRHWISFVRIFVRAAVLLFVRIFNVPYLSSHSTNMIFLSAVAASAFGVFCIFYFVCVCLFVI